MADELAAAAKPDPDEFLEVDEIARLLKVHPNTVRALGDRGELPYVRVGRQRRIRRSELDAYLERAAS